MDKPKKLFAAYIDCPFCEIRNNVNTFIYEGQIGICAECGTSFKIVGVRDEKVLTRIVASQNIKMQIGEDVIDVNPEVLRDLVEKGFIERYTNECKETGWRINDKGEEVLKKLKDSK